MKIFAVLALSVGIFLASAPLAEAGGFYLIPSIGASIPTEGDSDPALGVGAVAGYEFTSFLAAGLGYRYYYQTGSGELKAIHAYDANVTLFKRLVVLTPYFRVGAGAYTRTFDTLDSQTKPMVNVGAGLHVHPIPFLGLSIGVTYYVFEDFIDYFEPVICFGFSLGK